MHHPSVASTMYKEQQNLAITHLGWLMRAFSQPWEDGVRKPPLLSIIPVFHSPFKGEWGSPSQSTWMFLLKPSIQKFSSGHLRCFKQFKLSFLVPFNRMYIYTIKRYQSQLRVFSWWWKIFSLARFQNLLSWWLSQRGVSKAIYLDEK